MNFLKQQDNRRRQSALLLIAFVIAMMCMALVIHSIIAGLSFLLTGNGSFWVPTVQGSVMIAIVWITVIAGGFFRYLDVKAGGAVLARRFGAVHASERHRYEQEKQLLNVVAEMSIASATAQPEVYVLRRESSINALVLGSEQSHHTIVVTQGALDALNRQELQAVVAHEFGHIKNGDLPLNMRLLIILGGLLAIDEVGRLLIAKESDDTVHPGMLVGYVLIAIGSIGMFFGKIIRAAFSRQREYLADASAVQFTRASYPLASALHVIKEHDHEPMLHLAHSEELAHLCFQAGRKLAWYRRLLASHPEIQSRIDVIEPHFSTKQRKVENRKAVHEQKSGTTALSSGHHTVCQAAETELSTVSSGASHTTSHTANNNVVNLFGGNLSDNVLIMLSDKQTCIAGLFAVFATGDSDSREQYYNSLASGINDAFSEETRRVRSTLCDELNNKQLDIINHITSVLNDTADADTLLRIVSSLEQYALVKKDNKLMSFAIIQLIRRKLNIDNFTMHEAATVLHGTSNAQRIKSFDAMGGEFALLLSLMVESSGACAAAQDAQFQNVLKCYTRDSYPRRTANEADVIPELQAAFQTLLAQPESIRQAFVQHCVEIMQHDGYIVADERVLLDLFAASLGCEARLAA